MKKISLAFILLVIGLLAQAQTISVKSFQLLPMDMTTSSLEGKRIDRNGQVAALIKVVTTEKNFSFEGGTLGIVDSQQRKGEIWVWVPRGLRKITILHDQLGVLRDYRFPEEIEAERTYEMVLTSAKRGDEPQEQFLVFQISPPDAVLEVDNLEWPVSQEGKARRLMSFGTYTYRVQAQNYHSESGSVTVDDPYNIQTVSVTLTPNFATVTLSVDADAEIWVNNEKKGVRTWTGALGSDTYKIECKQANHEPSTVSKEITPEMNGQTIALPAPTPIYGSLNVESTPNLATIYIDGEEVGKTPKSISKILIGQHEVRLTKDDFSEYRETVTIAKGENKQVRATMDNATEVHFSCNVSDAELYIDGKLMGKADGTYKLSKGQHLIKAKSKTYEDEPEKSIDVYGNNLTCTLSFYNRKPKANNYSSKAVGEMARKPKRITCRLNPDPLDEGEDGKVCFDVIVTIPGGYFDKKAVVELNPYFEYDGGRIELSPIIFIGEKVKGGGDFLVNYKDGGKFIRHYCQDYEPEMKYSELKCTPVFFDENAWKK